MTTPHLISSSQPEPLSVSNVERERGGGRGGGKEGGREGGRERESSRDKVSIKYTLGLTTCSVYVCVL